MPCLLNSVCARSYLLMAAMLCGTAMAADLPGSADHPLLARYQDSEIIAWDHQAFAANTFIKAPIVRGGGLAANADAAERLEGNLTRLVYRSPANRSPLEVYRNYAQALSGAGFERQFECAQRECGGFAFNDLLSPAPYTVLFNGYYEDQQYGLFHLARPEGDVEVAVYVVLNKGGGINAGRSLVKVEVLEAAPMEQRMVVVKADTIDQDLQANGKVVFYGILFDTDKDQMRADSAPQLQEIAAVLKRSAQLKVLVVGHTDSQGALAYNQDLSQRRAHSIVQALITQYGIDGARMTPLGVGMAAPVATNRSDAGRAKNRRVELVEIPAKP